MYKYIVSVALSSIRNGSEWHCLVSETVQKWFPLSSITGATESVGVSGVALPTFRDGETYPKRFLPEPFEAY